jgi:hypothetical protein
MSRQTNSQDIFAGPCRSRATVYSIPVGDSRKHALALMKRLDRDQTLAMEATSHQHRERFSTASLFGPARGKMFGVMECLDGSGATTVIKAFSGQFNGAWIIDGWCPPLFDVSAFERLTGSVEKEIKGLGSAMEDLDRNSREWIHCRQQRRSLSRQLMQEIHELYELHTFDDRRLRLADIFGPGRGIPTGTGDCCAPKLLNHAAKNNLWPLGMCEFYWGRENLSGSRRHGTFYPPCDDKCLPILAAMLSGLQR